MASASVSLGSRSRPPACSTSLSSAGVPPRAPTSPEGAPREHRQRHAVEVARLAGVRRVEVAVGVEPDRRQPRRRAGPAAASRPARTPSVDVAVAGQHQRQPAVRRPPPPPATATAASTSRTACSSSSNGPLRCAVTTSTSWPRSASASVTPSAQIGAGPVPAADALAAEVVGDGDERDAQCGAQLSTCGRRFSSVDHLARRRRVATKAWPSYRCRDGWSPAGTQRGELRERPGRCPCPRPSRAAGWPLRGPRSGGPRTRRPRAVRRPASRGP